MVDQPTLASHERGMRWARQPLGQSHDVFEAGFLRSNREGNRSLNRIWIDRRTIIGALNVIQRVDYALDIAHLGDNDLHPLRFQAGASAIFSVPHRADRMARHQQFANHDATRLPGCAGHNDPWLNHEHLLLEVRQENPWFGTPTTRHDSGSCSDCEASYFRSTAEQQIERYEMRNQQY